MADKKPFGQTFGGQMLSGLGGSLVNGLFNIGAARRQFKYQSKLQQQQYDLNEKAADAAYERQKDFFNIQNEWNDPSAVRERYENANVNPTSAFGAAGSYTPAQQAATAPQGSGAGLGAASAFPVADPIEQAYRLAMIRNVDADTKKKEGETLDPGETKRAQQLENQLRELKIVGQDVLNQQSTFNLEFDQATREMNIDKLKQSVDNMKRQNENLQAEYIRIVNGTQLDQGQADLLRQQLQMNTARMSLMAVQEQALRSGMALNSATIAKLEEETSNLVELRERIKADTKLILTREQRESLLRDIDEIDKANRDGYWSAELSAKWSNVVKNYAAAGKDVSSEVGKWVYGSRH